MKVLASYQSASNFKPFYLTDYNTDETLKKNSPYF